MKLELIWVPYLMKWRIMADWSPVRDFACQTEAEMYMEHLEARFA